MNKRAISIDGRSSLKPLGTAKPKTVEADHPFPKHSTRRTTLALQRNLGNQAVGQLLDQRIIQAKLKLGPANDIYEQEADRVATLVMRMPDPSHIARSTAHGQQADIHRYCDNGEKALQRKAEEDSRQPKPDGVTATPSASFEGDVHAIRDGGSPLPESTRNFFEPRFEADFSDVRVHADVGAAALARQVNAKAFTLGRDLVFGAGQYAPGTEAGKHLLAHELTHVVQQSAAVSRPLGGSAHNKPNETGAFADTRISRVPARVIRAISFTRSNDKFTTHQAGTTERTDDFDIAPRGSDQHFIWEADITIHGTSGDSFGDWEVGPLQVVREWVANIYYGHGDKQTVHKGRAVLPARDEAPGGGPTWFNSALVARGYGASGESRHTHIEDSPGLDEVSFENPAPKSDTPTTTGRFELVQASVAYLSARNTTGTGPASFRHLGHVLWRFGMSGVFDSSRAVGSRILRINGGIPTHGPAASGVNAQYPPMHGGQDSASTVTWETA